MTLPARRCALFLSAFAVATAVPALSASSLLAQTSAQQVYEQPETRTTQSDLPEIPQVAGDHRTPPLGSSTDGPPEVAGEKPPVTPSEGVPPVTPGEGVPPVFTPVDVSPEANADDTLPVTGLDVMLLLGAAAAAGGVGFALRRGASR